MEAIVQGSARYGPLSLVHPNYGSGFTIEAEVMLDFIICHSGEHLSGRPNTLEDKETCEHCFSEQRLPRELTARCEGDETSASFCFELDTSYDFTSESRLLIRSTLDKIFKTENDVEIGNFFFATQRLSSLKLEVVWNGGQLYRPLLSKHEVLFEVFITDEESSPKIRMTYQRRSR